MSYTVQYYYSSAWTTASQHSFQVDAEEQLQRFINRNGWAAEDLRVIEISE